MSFSRPMCCDIWPQYFNFLTLILPTITRFWPIPYSMSSLDIYSVYAIQSAFLYHCISNASMLIIKVHASAAYVTIGHISDSISLAFSALLAVWFCQTVDNPVKSVIRLTRTTISNYSKTIKKHTVYQKMTRGSKTGQTWRLMTLWSCWNLLWLQRTSPFGEEYISRDLVQQWEV